MNEKDIMTLAEAIDYFELSRRKFSALLKSRHDFVIYYRNDYQSAVSGLSGTAPGT